MSFLPSKITNFLTLEPLPDTDCQQPHKMSSPDHITQLQYCCKPLIRITQAAWAYKGKSGALPPMSHYSRLRPEVEEYFAQQTFEDLTVEAYALILVIKCLSQAMESLHWAGTGIKFDPIAFPEAEMDQGEKKALKQAVYETVDELIWGRGDSDVLDIGIEIPKVQIRIKLGPNRYIQQVEFMTRLMKHETAIAGGKSSP